MQVRLLHLIARRLHSSTSEFRALRRFSSSSEDVLTENPSIFDRERPTQLIKKPQSYKYSPSQNFASGPNSESNSNPNPHPNPQDNPNFEHNANPPNPKIDSNTDPSSDASFPEVEKCIWAVERLSKGKRFAMSDRNYQRVPGYVFEQDTVGEHVLILMDRFQIQGLLDLLGPDRFLRTIFTLEIFDGLGSNNILYRQSVLPRRINFGKSNEITNVGFANAPPGMKLRLDVPIRFYGQEDCTGLKKGGSLKVHLSYASLLCLPEELPPYLEIHVNKMDIGDRICLGDLGNGVPLHSNQEPSLPICEII